MAEKMALKTEGTERVTVSGDALRNKVEELLHEGNVRRIVVKDSEDRTVMELPLTLGILGVVVAPMLAAVSAIAGAAAHWTLEIERREDGDKSAAGPVED